MQKRGFGTFPASRVWGALLACCLMLAGCGRTGGRWAAADLAEQHGFEPLRLEEAGFVLQGWLRPGGGDVLHVYLEGDGSAWTRRGPSSDPTPRRPTGFELAASDPASGPVFYLGRPCQYVEGEDRRLCEKKFWTSDRYGEHVLRSVSGAIDQLKERTATAFIAVYGFSGGGALAALLAERRDDVLFLGTVAGNLDVEGWTRHHGLTPLTGSLNPASARADAAHVPQVHVTGSADVTVPPFFAVGWCRGLPEASCRVVELEGTDHQGGWAAFWPDILRRYRPEF